MAWNPQYMEKLNALMKGLATHEIQDEFSGRKVSHKRSCCRKVREKQT